MMLVSFSYLKENGFVILQGTAGTSIHLNRLFSNFVQFFVTFYNDISYYYK